MKTQIQLTNTIALARNKLDQLPWRRLVFIMPLAASLALVAVSPPARACDEWCEVDGWPQDTGFGTNAAGYETGNTGTDDSAFGYLALGWWYTLLSGSYNTAIGSYALTRDTTGTYNTASGAYAMAQTTSDVVGSYNTASGAYALWGVTNGASNTATGAYSLYEGSGSSNTATGAYAMESGSGSFNTATGSAALYYNSGSYNTATGFSALDLNTSGQYNTATGTKAMYGVLNSSTGSYNTATGYQALYGYTTGSYNTATGVSTLLKDTTGGSNTANGYAALYYNVSGNYNTATGRGALYKNTGSNNTATGYQALNLNGVGQNNAAFGMQALQNNTTGYSNVAIGTTALQSNSVGSSNIAIGTLAGYSITGSNNIDIGNQGTAGESGIIRIGTAGTHTNALIAGICNVPVSGLSVVVGSGGQLGTSTSSARFKDDIKPMNKASEAILSLEPVTFRYKKDIDPKAIPQFGLVAEQVEKVDPDLVARDEHGKPFSVRYEAVNAMLLNEFLKEHEKVQKLEAVLEAVNQRLKAQDAKIERVNAKVELRRSEPQVALASP